MQVSVSLNAADYVDSGVSYIYYDELEVSSISPSSGSVLGGTSVVISGSNFVLSKDLSCRFGTVVATARFVNKTELICFSPSTNVGSVSVSVSRNGVDFSLARDAFMYVKELEVLSIWPHLGSLSGGTLVRVRGSGFEEGDRLQCVFGGTGISDVMYISQTELQCMSPARDIVETVAVQLTSNGVDMSRVINDGRFEYIYDAMVLSIHPDTGPVNGGTVVLLMGHDFLDNDSLMCRFGDVVVSGRWISSTEIECISPAHFTGLVYIAVSNDGFFMRDSQVRFEYVDHPVVFSIFPDFGFNLSGSSIVIRGSGFYDKTGWFCWFGNISSEAFVLSNMEAACDLPSRVYLSTPFELSTPRGSPSPTGLSFEIIPALTVESASPLSGPKTGNTTVTVGVSGLQHFGLYSCFFGSASVPAHLLNDTHVVCETPSVSWTGSTFLSITRQELLDNIGDDGLKFFFYDSLVVHNICPSWGKALSLTKISISGSGIRDSLWLSCRFGDIIVPAHYLSPHQLLCESPLLGPGSVDLEVSSNGVDFTSHGLQFQFIQEFSIHSIRPKHGHVAGGTQVIVRGTGFSNKGVFSCLFGDIPVEAMQINTNKLICVSPSQLSTSKQLLRVCLGKNDCIGDAIYEFVDEVKILDLSPKYGPVGGGTMVLVQINNAISSSSNVDLVRLRFRCQH